MRITLQHWSLWSFKQSYKTLSDCTWGQQAAATVHHTHTYTHTVTEQVLVEYRAHGCPWLGHTQTHTVKEHTKWERLLSTCHGNLTTGLFCVPVRKLCQVGALKSQDEGCGNHISVSAGSGHLKLRDTERYVRFAYTCTQKAFKSVFFSISCQNCLKHIEVLYTKNYVDSAFFI